MSKGAAQAAVLGCSRLPWAPAFEPCLRYTGQSIARTFFVTAGMYAAISLYGYTTKADLTRMGDFMMMGLIGIIIAVMVNIFLADLGAGSSPSASSAWSSSSA